MNTTNSYLTELNRQQDGGLYAVETLPCPFCGNPPKIYQDIKSTGYWIVACVNFGDPEKPASDVGGCFLTPCTKWYLDRSMAIKHWNTRP